MKLRINPAALAGMDEIERGKALALLRRYEERAKYNPLEVYRPHEKQRECHGNVGVKTRAFFGGNRAGKTTMGVCDSLIQATPLELVPPHLRPYKRFSCPFYCRVVAPSNKQLQKVIIPKFREWTPKPLLPGGQFDKAYKKFDAEIVLECGCRFDLTSQEQDLDKFGGSALHRILYDEEPPEDIRDECWARLIDYGGDELFSMTPLKGLTWMFEDIYEASMDESQANRLKVTIASMFDNEYLPETAKEEVLAMWGHDSEVAQARIHGNFIHFGGMVLPKWQEAMREPVELRELRHKKVYVGIDPGVRNTAVVWAYYDEASNTFTLFDCIKVQDRDVEQIAAEIHAINRQWEVERPIYAIDPSARNRTLTHATSVETEFHNYGIYPRHAQNEVEAGVMQMRRRINHGLFKVGKNLGEWVSEARQYRIDEDTADGKFRVVKENDHLMDATRYLVMEEPYNPRRMPDPSKVIRDQDRVPPPPKFGRGRHEPSSARFA